jgi:hypothetical protein
MFREASGLLGFGMHQQTAAADGVTEAGDTADPIQQQGRTESLAFMAYVHPQPGQQGGGLGIASGATAGCSGSCLRLIRRGRGKGRGPRQSRQVAGRAAVDPLPFLLGVGIEQKVLTISQHPLGGHAPLGEQEGTAVGAQGSSGPIEQGAVVLCGAQLDPTGLGRPVTLRLGAGHDRKA